jgi:hypothetical protein
MGQREFVGFHEDVNARPVRVRVRGMGLEHDGALPV